MIYKILMIIISVLPIHLCALYLHPNQESDYSMNNTKMKLIIDTDAGGDDAVAIFLILAVKNIHVLAITCVYGNVNEANVETNILKILTIANRSDIAVYGGALKPLLQNYTTTKYFGNDGFGDFEFEEKITGTIDRSKHASFAMIELSKKYPGDINILTLGPLTNIALATSLDSQFSRRINRFYIMGSIINKHEQNLEEAEIEFNFKLDPESNAIFLSSLTNFRSFIIPWDVVLKKKISKQWRTEVLGKLNSKVIKYLNKIENIVLKNSTEWLASDSIAAALILWPDLVTTSLEARMSSITCGPFKGSVLVQVNNINTEEKNVEIVRNFNVLAYKEKLMQYLC